MIPEIFQRGDFVEIIAGDDRANGMVVLASPNGKSLMVMFEAILDGHVGQMPLSAEDDGSFIAVLTGRPVTLRKATI